jgi:hypothetical protein
MKKDGSHSARGTVFRQVLHKNHALVTTVRGIPAPGQNTDYSTFTTH